MLSFPCFLPSSDFNHSSLCYFFVMLLLWKFSLKPTNIRKYWSNYIYLCLNFFSVDDKNLFPFLFRFISLNQSFLFYFSINETWEQKKKRMYRHSIPCRCAFAFAFNLFNTFSKCLLDNNIKCNVFNLLISFRVESITDAKKWLKLYINIYTTKNG